MTLLFKRNARGCHKEEGKGVGWGRDRLGTDRQHFPFFVKSQRKASIIFKGTLQRKRKGCAGGAGEEGGRGLG